MTYFECWKFICYRGSFWLSSNTYTIQEVAAMVTACNTPLGYDKKYWGAEIQILEDTNFRKDMVEHTCWVQLYECHSDSKKFQSDGPDRAIIGWSGRTRKHVGHICLEVMRKIYNVRQWLDQASSGLLCFTYTFGPPTDMVCGLFGTAGATYLDVQRCD